MILGRTLAFNIEPNEFVQILHTGKGHWVTISTIVCTAGEVNVFDSFPPATMTNLLDEIAAILCTPKKKSRSTTLMCYCGKGFRTLEYFPLRMQLLWPMESNWADVF